MISTHSTTAITVGGRKKAIRIPRTNPRIPITKTPIPSFLKNTSPSP